jgi:hypothetical protein
MPESRTERLICLAGIVVLGLLVVLIVPEWQERARPDAVGAGPAPGEVAPDVSASASEGFSASGARREGVARTPHTLRLTAARGDCWLLVKSSNGRTLFTGTLPRAKSLTFRGGEFRVRMGAGQNLAAVFDGVPVPDLPAGTATVAVELGNLSVLELG